MCGSDSTVVLDLPPIPKKEVIVKKGRVHLDYHPLYQSLPIIPLLQHRLRLLHHLLDNDSLRLQ
jgi:hypothetical protein